VILILIPLMLMSLTPDYIRTKLHKYVTPGKHVDRTWRINEILNETYDDFSMQWEVDGKDVYFYNSVMPARVDSIVNRVYQPVRMTWVTRMKTIYTYHPTNGYVSNILLSVDFGSGLVPFMRRTLNFDANDYLTSLVTEFNDYDTSQWYVFMWIKINFVTTSDYSVCTYFAGGDTEPAGWNRMSFTWDTQGRIISETSQSSPDSLIWTNSYRKLYTYHPNDTTTGDIFVQNLPNHLAFDSENIEYIRSNMLGMMSLEIDQNWEGNMWVNNNRSRYYYNTSDDVVEYYHDWFGPQSQWENSRKAEYTYNTDNNLYRVLVYSWNDCISAWRNDMRFTLTWGQPTANDDNSVPAAESFSLSAYPNPFNAETSIYLSTKAIQPAVIGIYNLKGQLIKEFGAKSNSPFTWNGTDKSNLSVTKGIYFIRAKVNGITKTAKVLKLN